MMTVTLLVVVGAFVVTLLAAIGKAPLWVAVLLLTIAHLLNLLPR